MSSPIRILNLEPEDYSSKAESILRTIGELENGPMERAELLSQIGNYDVLITRLGHKIDGEVLERAKRLRAIVSATTGLNHIDLMRAEQQGIKVLSLKGEQDFLDTVYATAEHTFALLLSLIRKIPQACHHTQAGNWDRNLFKGRELHGATLGIVGLGRIGSKVARFGLAFGMRVVACDKATLHNPPREVEMLPLETLLGISDIISLHADYTQSNDKMLSWAEFGHMKSGALFINTARGELVNEAALLDALKSGRLQGAALDVLTGENTRWQTSKELLSYSSLHDNLLITPHIGGATHESMEKTEVFMANKLCHYYGLGIATS